MQIHACVYLYKQKCVRVDRCVLHVYVPMHVHICVETCAPVHMYTLYIYIYVHMCVCIYVYAICTCVSMRLSLNVSVCVHVHVCV